MFDKNKFLIYTNQGIIQELTFFEKSYSVLDFSCKGEICISVQNPNKDIAESDNVSKKFNLQTININQSNN